jgi:hypothetical protein
MDSSRISQGILIALAAMSAPSVDAQHHRQYVRPFAPPVYVPYLAPAVTYMSRTTPASGTRDTSADRLYYVPSQLDKAGISDIQYRATLLSNMYRSGAISSQQYREIYDRIASER